MKLRALFPSLPTLTLVGVLGALCVPAGVALADDPSPVPTPKVTAEQWHERAQAWFKAGKDDEKGRKDQMKEAGKAIKRPCKFCHDVSDDSAEGMEVWRKFYVDAPKSAMKPVTQQMMALSAEQGVPCNDCHAGKDKMTELGEKAEKFYKVAREKQVFCDECHKAGSKFKEEGLTDAGKKYHEEIKAKGG